MGDGNGHVRIIYFRDNETREGKGYRGNKVDMDRLNVDRKGNLGACTYIYMAAFYLYSGCEIFCIVAFYLCSG
jgi:hypothetical protein